MEAMSRSRGHDMGFRWSFSRLGGLFLLFVFAAVVSACDTGPAESLWDPDAAVGAEPSISGVDPPDIALSGVDVITITGQNFSATQSNNLVFFNATPVPVLQSSTTELKVRTPIMEVTSVTIRVAVVGGDAESFSNGYQLGLLPAAEEFGDILRSERVFAVATDSNGDIFASVFQGGRSVGIRRITPAGEADDYYTSTFPWDGFDFGPDGALYAVRGVRAIFQFAPEGGTQATWAVEANTAVKFVDVDFDGLGNLWAVGDNENLYRVSPDKTITPFPFAANVQAVKVAGSELYALVDGTGGGELWRFMIDGAGNINAGELFFDVGVAAGSEVKMLSLEAAQNGDLFVGTDAEDPIWVVHADRTGEVLYPGVLDRPAESFAWIEETFLIMVEGLRGVEGETVSLQKINTRRTGIR